MGDLNVAPTAKGNHHPPLLSLLLLMIPGLDLANPKPNWNKTAGYTKDETEAFEHILNPPESEQGAAKFVDVWRHMHPDDQHYTYFSYRFNCRSKGMGWRLDMCKSISIALVCQTKVSSCRERTDSGKGQIV